jgi:hypothetical protein
VLPLDVNDEPLELLQRLQVVLIVAVDVVFIAEALLLGSVKSI